MTTSPSPVWNGDYLIIGAGPAGLQLGWFLQKAGLDYLILEEANVAGSFFKNFPRHRQLISINKIHTGFEDAELNLRWDWNSLLADDDSLLFKHYSKEYFPNADDLVQYLGNFAQKTQLNIKYGVTVDRITKPDHFVVFDALGDSYHGKRLIVATGLSKPFVPKISGIELTENYTDVSVDPDDFINQQVLIIGKGNSAFEVADNLVSSAAIIHIIDPSPVTMAWKTHYVGHLRAVNNNFLDTYQLKSQNAILDAHIKQIKKLANNKLSVSIEYSHANGQSAEYLYDRIITCTGFSFDPEIFDDNCIPELTPNKKFPLQTSSWESTNIEGLFFAGILMHMRDFHKTTSGFIHGFRYNLRVLSQIFAYKYHRQPLNYSSLDASPESLNRAVLQRLNQSSALWQQFGFLGDVICVTGREARYYNELPLDYVHDYELGKSNDYYIVTLEFGSVVEDPFNIERSTDQKWVDKSPYLHPVVRHYSGSSLLSEQHLLEDLYGEWEKEEYSQSLLNYFISSQKDPLHQEKSQ